jgi:hypothetical protein
MDAQSRGDGFAERRKIWIGFDVTISKRTGSALSGERNRSRMWLKPTAICGSLRILQQRRSPQLPKAIVES